MNWEKLRRKLLGRHKKAILPTDIKLPVLPTALLEFSRQSVRPDANPKLLGEIIESDAGLTCELLRYVNSSSVGVRQKVSSAQQAVALLGARTARLYLMTTSLGRAMKTCESKLINIQVFWNTNLERAIFAREVARLFGADGDLAFAGGMLQDFLLPILTSYQFDDYLKFWNLDEAQHVELHLFEEKACGWNHGEAAAQVMLSWGFPDDLICCVASHHQRISDLLALDDGLSNSTVVACAIAGLMPDTFHQVPDGIEQLIRLESELKWPGFNLFDLAQKVDSQFKVMSSGYLNLGHLTFLQRLEDQLQESSC